MVVFKRVKTPCIGVCSTGIGDDVCRGCKRFGHEVIDWNTYNEEQRRLIADRLQDFLSQVVANKIDIVDQKQLERGVEHQQLVFDQDQNPLCWVFSLLKAGASQIRAEDYGLRLKPAWQNKSLPEIKDTIDKDYYALSCAHYARYFSAGAELTSIDKT